MGKIGVYRIRNIINDRQYIGSSVSVNRRWSDHKRSLRKGKHHSVLLQRSFDKYGEEAFIFEMITSCNEDGLLKFEQMEMDTEQPEFNIARIAGRPERIPHHIPRTAFKKGRIPWNKDKKYPGKGFGQKPRSVSQFTREGDLIMIFSSLKEAASIVAGNKSNISSACRGRLPTYRNFIWKYT